MAFPDEVVLTTVFGEYLDVTGAPAGGEIIFLPDMSAVGEDIAVAPIAVSRKFDKDGKFTQAVPASVNTGLDPDFTYRVDWHFNGGEYRTKIVQIPVSATPVNIDELIEVVPTNSSPRFQLPMRAAAPTNPQPGQMYYNTTDGNAYVYDDVADVWIDLTAAASGGGGAPSGPAGGSLAGTYPNPTLAANSVGTAQIADDAVTAAKLSVDYVPLTTYNSDLATTALALGDLEDADTALANSIALKAPIASPAFTGTVTGVTATMVGADPTGTATSAVSAHSADTTSVHGIADTANLVLTNDARLTNARTPTVHATSHQDGGADELALDGSQITTGTVAIGRIPTGSTGATVPFGNDARLSDARTPTAHAVSHTDGGSDEISIGGSQVTSGTVAFARLPTGTGGAQVAIGTHDHNGVYQPLDSDLTTIAGLTATTDNFMQAAGSVWASRTPAQAKTSMALNNVDNTSDANKPVSTDQQAALNLKADLASPALTGNPTAPTQTAGNNSTRVATTAFVTTAVAGGGGGSTLAVKRAVVSSGNITPQNTSSAWQALTGGPTLVIPAVAGDYISVEVMSVLMTRDNATFWDLSVLNGASLVRFGSSGTGTPATEGDGSFYPDINFPRSGTVFDFVAESGDINSGNITICWGVKSGGAGQLHAGFYPLRWRVMNHGAATVS